MRAFTCQRLSSACKAVSFPQPDQQEPHSAQAPPLLRSSGRDSAAAARHLTAMPASLHLLPRPPAGGAVARRCARPARPVASAAASSPAPAGPPPVDPSVRTAMITGANTGIGYETAKSLAQQGYHVVLACRDKSKAEAARARLREAVPGSKLEVVQMDLADLESVRAFCSRALDFGHPLSLLVNNAGVMAPPRLETKDGFELQFGVNHLGHFLLTNMLLPLLTSDPANPGRIVNVSSMAHLFGHINFDDLNSEKSYSRWGAYGQSKLANVLFTYELARQLGSKATVNTLHPGVVNTELQRYLLPAEIPGWQQPIFDLAGRMFGLTPEEGARTSIYLASSPEVQGLTAKYFDKCKPVSSSSESYDTGVQRRLWDVSAELVRL